MKRRVSEFPPRNCDETIVGRAQLTLELQMQYNYTRMNCLDRSSGVRSASEIKLCASVISKKKISILLYVLK